MAGFGTTFYTYKYNENMINKYLDLITTQSTLKIHAFNVDFIDKYLNDGMRETKVWTKIPVLNTKIILFPIHIKEEWALIVIFTKIKTIACYYNKNLNYEFEMAVIKKFLISRQTIIGHHPSKWKSIYFHIPKQSSSHNSGPWILHLAKCISFNNTNIQHNYMPVIRKTQYKELMMDQIIINAVEVFKTPPTVTTNDTVQKKKKKKNVDHANQSWIQRTMD
ncbi:unnamed protein product [Macrosiphum euphorbiae]|uniref:Ubiquitin-like protease family profile domain-containing protein n=2 Tax=Macrosiphum euphorbiae TaxID=13131 RepID=A0AAV0YBH2_9HEMI|nr:unnamed protein product [Macrosiphum euphorbiae]